jgi:hypothetical protein
MSSGISHDKTVVGGTLKDADHGVLFSVPLVTVIADYHTDFAGFGGNEEGRMTSIESLRDS